MKMKVPKRRSLQRTMEMQSRARVRVKEARRQRKILSQFLKRARRIEIESDQLYIHLAVSYESLVSNMVCTMYLIHAFFSGNGV